MYLMLPVDGATVIVFLIEGAHDNHDTDGIDGVVFLQIQAGDRMLGPFCGDRSPGTIHTGSNIVSVLFHSDNSGENSGWKLTYTSTGNCTWL